MEGGGRATYQECGSGELEQALRDVLAVYNQKDHLRLPLDLVFFPAAIDHVAKLCRLLVSVSTEVLLAVLP